MDEGNAAAAPPRPLASWYAQGRSDALGDRLLMFDNSNAPSLELLRFRPDFTSVPAFERALRDRVQRLSGFHHPAFARVRAVQRLEPDDDLALVSNSTPGKRLSEVLHQVRGPAFAATLIRQLAPALAALQQHDAGVAHGVLSPDRIVVSPDGRLTIVEHVIGPAIDALDLRGSQLTSLGVAVPPGDGGDGGLQRLDAGSDWYQLGLVAVSVLLGRPVADSELPRLESVLDDLDASAGPGAPGVPPAIRQWLNRSLRLSGSQIESSVDAQAALAELFPPEPAVVRRFEPQAPEPALPGSRARPPAGSPTPATRPSARVVAPPPDPVQAKARPTSGPTAHRPDSAPAQQPLLMLDAEITPSSRPQPSAVRPRRQVRTDAEAAAAAARHARAEPRPRARASGSALAVAALGLIAAVEAGVIVGLARVVWSAPNQAIVAAADPAGDDVVVSSASPGDAPLSLVVAPDLRWIRVTRSSAGASGQRGTLQISSPIDLKVYEQSRLLGSAPGPGLDVSPGRHDLTLINQALGYSMRQSLEIGPGQTVSLHVAPKDGWVTVDAAPWADVSIDGASVGRTPLQTLPIAPGEHEVVFRHPTAGTDRKRITVKSDAISRVTGNLQR